MSAEKTVKIKIIKPPKSEAPLWVRKRWVGLVLPVDTSIDTSFTMGIFGGPPQNQGGYAVKVYEALRILSEKNTRKDRSAVRYFHSSLPFESSHLIFGKDSCEVVE